MKIEIVVGCKKSNVYRLAEGMVEIKLMENKGRH